MNSIEDRLRSDAAKISAKAPTSLLLHLQRKINPDMQRSQAKPVRLNRTPPVLALAASLAVAALAVTWVARVPSPSQVQPEVASEASLLAYQGTVMRLSRVMEKRPPTEAKLNAEMQHLNADLRRIRSHVRNQLDPLL